MRNERFRQCAAGLFALGGLAAVGVLLALGGSGEIARAQYGSATPINVSAFGCIVGRGGYRTVPAESTIVIRSGYATTAPGAVQAFLKKQATMLSVNDAPMVDVSQMWGPIEANTGGGSVIFVSYDTKVTLWNAGDSMRFTFAQVAKTAITDPSDYDGDGTIDPLRGTAGLLFGGTCTVTAS